MERPRRIAVLFFFFLLPLAASAQPAPEKAKPAPVTDRAHLGLQFQPIRREEPEGVVVTYVYPRSAAEAMGFRTGDEVLEVNGAAVPDRRFLAGQVRQRSIKDPVSFKVRREGQILDLKGALGSYQETRKAFLDLCRRELIGRPFAPTARLEWPDGIDGVQALRGKVGVLVSFDDCQECTEGKWRKVLAMDEALRKAGASMGWLGFAGIYSKIGESHEKNLEGRRKALSRHRSTFPVAVARYPDDRVPAESAARDALAQELGVALLDPEGKLFYLELDNPSAGILPTTEFLKAFKGAQERFGPKAGGPPAPPTKN
jgi:hypothetical protein